jgi:O-acetyl-ADP-ribose deacetylase (regulator of RNase III)
MTDEHIRYVHGDATQPVGEGNKLIVHVCNDMGAWGAGFVIALSKRWKEPEEQYRQWIKTFPRVESNGFRFYDALGQVQFVQVAPDLTVGNMLGQHLVGRDEKGETPVRYEAIEQALRNVAEFAVKNNVSVHMPRIGCGLAGGEWNKVEPLILEQLSSLGIPVTVYDF